MYGDIFSQFMENRWEYPYLSYSWILRDFCCDKIRTVDTMKKLPSLL